MTKQTKVLDHGYVQFIGAWGSDEEIVEAARMSTGKGFKGWNDLRNCIKCGVGYPHAHDRETGEPLSPGNQMMIDCAKSGGHKWEGHPGDGKLLAYLWKNKHSTPFEMAGLTIEVKAPIFVFRQWHRHRTQSYNEMSARYTPLPDENYVPSSERLRVSGGTNKQARAATAVELTEEGADWFKQHLRRMYENQEALYQEALKRGVPKELARIHLPVARYSRMRASANLRNWLAFLTLRLDSHAQWEIREYASAVGALAAAHFPRTWELFIGPKAPPPTSSQGGGESS